MFLFLLIKSQKHEQWSYKNDIQVYVGEYGQDHAKKDSAMSCIYFLYCTTFICRLSVSIVNRPKFNEGKEGLFALFDGGRNDEVTRILANRITALMEEESQHPITNQEYLKYTLLSAHR